MKVNLEKAIQNINVKVGFFRPLYEAIVNSIQAKANKIDITFDIEKEQNLDLINGYTIKDNGHGFLYDDIDAFLTLWTKHNSEQGALGSGRILCLKVFNNILIESQTKNFNNKKGKKTLIDFNIDFSANTVEEVDRKESSSEVSYTITTYQNLTDVYRSEREILNLNILKKEFFISLLPLFIEFNNSKQDLTITLNGEIWINKEKLNQKFKELSFKTKNIKIPATKNDDTSIFDFYLTYRIENDKKNAIDQFYGASFRKVTDFATNSRIKRLPNDASAIFCLSGNYLSDRVADSREEFTLGFNENNASEKHPLLFRDINKKLTEEINLILKKEFPKIKEKLEIEKQSAINENPYLTQYIKKIDKLTVSKNDIVKIAQKEFDKKYKSTKKEIIKFSNEILKTKNFEKDKYIKITKDFTEVGQEQLAYYIAYRQTIIEMLFHVHKCNKDPKQKSYDEDYIHDLIMPQKKVKQDNKHLITENNFWLLDDKFMSYSYTASDTDIKTILDDLTEELDDDTIDLYGKDRPDLLMLYSDEFNNEKDVVIVELKKINVKPYEKVKAIDQLNTYSRIVKENIPKVNDIFVYAIFDLDPKIENLLLDRGFFPKALTKDGHNIKSYHMYNPNRQANVNVLSFEHMILDASKRNSLFLDILKNEISFEEAEIQEKKEKKTKKIEEVE